MPTGNQITERIIGCAIEVHRALGPGLLESAYEECFCHELAQNGFAFKRQVSLPVVYKGIKLDCGYIHDDLNLALLPHPHPDPPLEGEGIIRVSSPSGRGLR